MTALFRILATAACIACVAVNLTIVREPLAERLKVDRRVAKQPDSIRRTASLYSSDLGLIVGLHDEIARLREDGYETIAVSYGEKFSNVLFSMAVHQAYPAQIVEQKFPADNRRSRLKDARRRGATAFISLIPGRGWTGVDVADALAREKASDDDDSGPKDG